MRPTRLLDQWEEGARPLTYGRGGGVRAIGARAAATHWPVGGEVWPDHRRGTFRTSRGSARRRRRAVAAVQAIQAVQGSRGERTARRSAP